MGVLYSTWSYIASYFKQEGNEHLNAVKIKISAQKLSHTLRLKQMKLQDKTKVLEKELVEMVESPVKSSTPVLRRNLDHERAIMQEIVINSELLAGYE